MAPETKDTSNVGLNDSFLRGFYPIALMARFFGYFPFSNICEYNISASKLSVKRFRLDLIIALIALTLTIENNYRTVVQWSYPSVDAFKMQVLTIYFVGYRNLSVVILLFLSVFRNNSLVRYFENMCSANNDFIFKGRKRSLKILSISLFLMLFTACFTFLICFSYKNTSYKTYYELISTYYVVAAVLFSYTFLGSFIIYSTCCLGWGFQTLIDDLASLTSSNLIGYFEFPAQLSIIRLRHERLVTLIDDLNSILSPLLTIFVLGQSVSICVNIYELCYYICQSEPATYLLISASYSLMRLVPLVAVFITSSAMTHKANSLFQPLYNCQMQNISREAKFQIQVLLKHLQCRKALLSADGILDVNNQVLAEIFGAIVTYNVVMMEISDGRQNR